MMMPFGNMCAYFKLPDWVNFGSDHEEKDHDPPDVKALKVSTVKCVLCCIFPPLPSHILILTIFESTEVPEWRQ